MRELSLAGVVREEDSVRIVRVGIGETESGLIFTKSRRMHEPKAGEGARDGRQYLTVEELVAGVYFYETN